MWHLLAWAPEYFPAAQLPQACKPFENFPEAQGVHGLHAAVKPYVPAAQSPFDKMQVHAPELSETELPLHTGV
jgi:hypothetical protein